MKKYMKLRSQEGRKKPPIRKKRDSKEAKKRKSTTPSSDTQNSIMKYTNTDKADVNKKMKNTTPTKPFTPQEDTTNDRKT